MCDRHLNDGPLVCVRDDPHATGHVYRSSTASDLDDKHTEGGHG
jgi:hypothetical protein